MYFFLLNFFWHQEYEIFNPPPPTSFQTAGELFIFIDGVH